MHRPQLPPVALALCLMGCTFGAQAATYIVPPGATKVKFTLQGAGGGAGGADADGGGGKGANGSLIVVQFDVEPGKTVDYVVGQGGKSGESWVKLTAATRAPMKGGVGGAGQGVGGNGGDAPLANFDTTRGWGPDTPDPESGSGGGGGGGGATSVSYNGLWARAGGGGGGGGGSWFRTALDGATATTAPTVTADCANDGPGVAGEAGTGHRSQVNNGGGGGGGAGGGYLVSPAVPPAAAGFDGSSSAQGGAPGASCVSPGVTLLSSVLDGGGAGSSNPPATSSGEANPTDPNVPKVPAPADDGVKGDFVPEPVIEPIKPVLTPLDGGTRVDVALPPSIKSSDVVSYSFTCDPALGSQGVSFTATSLPLTVTGLTNDQKYTCHVVANLVDPNNQTAYSTPDVYTAEVTPKAKPPLEPAKPTATPGNASATLDATLPPSINPANVVDYSFTCTPKMGSRDNPIVTATLPITITGLTNDQTYNCRVVANVRNPDDQTTSTTPDQFSVDVTPKGDPEVKPPITEPGNPAHVPTLGEWALILLSTMLAALGMTRMRRSTNKR